MACALELLGSARSALSAPWMMAMAVICMTYVMHGSHGSHAYYAFILCAATCERVCVISSSPIITWLNGKHSFRRKRLCTCKLCTAVMFFQ